MRDIITIIFCVQNYTPVPWHTISLKGLLFFWKLCSFFTPNPEKKKKAHELTHRTVLEKDVVKTGGS